MHMIIRPFQFSCGYCGLLPAHHSRRPLTGLRWIVTMHLPFCELLHGPQKFLAYGIHSAVRASALDWGVVCDTCCDLVRLEPAWEKISHDIPPSIAESTHAGGCHANVAELQRIKALNRQGEGCSERLMEAAKHPR